ncbi:hypothetical protein BV25DRAFT_225141 [Artomyces pyxidatus]|uniref:Uncharacterized protein n=1 Tax=Artomyces pyxidatus TaxID=48021 RepID=A0ACB8T818_9AGAM|nr:hypothetical protein BV25DRAFT_225141 [Artomyces pyxidatus]
MPWWVLVCSPSTAGGAAETFVAAGKRLRRALEISSCGKSGCGEGTYPFRADGARDATTNRPCPHGPRSTVHRSRPRRPHTHELRSSCDELHS